MTPLWFRIVFEVSLVATTFLNILAHDNTAAAIGFVAMAIMMKERER